MKNKIVIISAIVLGTFALTAFVSSKNNSKPEYALFEFFRYSKNDHELNLARIKYGNGTIEDLKIKLGIDFKQYDDSNFYYAIKVFNYLNEKGYKLQTHAFFDRFGYQQFIFIKE